MTKDDFFVRFGSDAEIWANNIERQLDRVQRRVVTVQRALNGLDKKAIEALGPGGGGGGGGGRRPSLPTGTGPSVDSIVEGMAEAAGDMKFVAGALKRSVASIDAIPGKLDSAIKRLVDKLGAHGRTAVGEGPDVDPLAPGSRFLAAGGGTPLGSEGELFWRDMRQRFGAVAGQQALISKAGIAGVNQKAIDKASTDRIVKAINKQTDMLKSRLKNLEVRDGRTGVADDDGPTASKRKSPKRSGARADTGVRQVETGLADYIAQTDERIARIGAAIEKLTSSGAAVPDDLIQALSAQRKDRANMAAALRAEERERTGVSQSEQKARSQKKFRDEQKARPTITDEERDERIRRQALAASPLASDFDTRLGRKGKKNGNYSEQDLLDMAETLGMSGIQVKRGRSKQEFAQNLKQGSREYFELHGSGGDPAYRVDSNAVVKKTTKIAGDLARVLGDFTQEARESAEAWEIVAKDVRGGGNLVRKALRDTAEQVKAEKTLGVGPPTRVISGNINVPPGMVKGREGRGAGFMPEDEAAYARARQVIEEGGRASARQRAAELLRKSPGLNIHDPALDAGIQQGSAPGAKGEALTARRRLRAMREYFREVDAQAEDWRRLSEAMGENRGRQGELRRSLVAHEKVPAGQRTPEHEQEIRRLVSDLDQVDTELRNMEVALQRIPGVVRQLAQDPKFQAGARQRQATTIEREAEALTRGERRFTLSDLQLYRTGGGQALGGSRLPGGQSGQTLVKPFAAAVGFSDEKGFYSPNDQFGGKQQQKLNQAWTKLTGAIIARDKLMREGVTDEQQVNAALEKVEQAADTFAGRFARVSGGLAPSFEQLSGGQLPSDPGVAQRDELRRARMEQVRRDEARLPTKANRSQVFAYSQDRDAAEGSKRRLAAAMERQRTAVDAVTKAEEKLDAVFATLTREEREEIRVAQGLIDAKEAELNQVERRARIWEGPLSREKIPAREGHSPAAPVDTMGYPSSLGYNPDLQEHTTRLQQQIDEARGKRDVLAQRAFNPEGAAGQSAAELRKELDRLRTTVRREIVARIAAARDEGDLKENAGYHAARQDLALNLSRTAQLQSKLDESGFGAYDKLAEEANRASGEVARLEKELADANAGLSKSTTAWEKRKKQLADERAGLVGQGPYKGADLKRLRDSKDPASGAQFIAAMTRARRIAEIDREVGGGSAKRQTLVETRALSAAEKDRVQAQPHTRAERKLATLDGDTKLADQINTRRTRISAIGQELKSLGVVRPTRGGAAGGGAAGGGPAAPSGAAGSGGVGGQIGVLRQILAAVKAFHSDVKGGKVAPATGRATRTVTTKTVPSGKGELGSLAEFSDDPAVQAAIAAQQQVEAARTRTAKPARTPGTTQTAQDAAKIRDEIRQKETLATAYDRVDRQILEQVNHLRQLTIASRQAGTAEEQHARQVALAAQQLKVYMAIEEKVAAAGGGGAARRETARALLRSADPDMKGKEFDAVASQARASRGFVDVGHDWAGDAEEGFGGVFGRSGFFKRVIASTGTFIVRNFTAGFVFGLTAAMQQVIDQAIQTEATFVRVSAALQATGKDIGNIRGDLQQISTDYGVQLNDVYDTAAGLAGLFDNTEDLAAATRIVAQLQTISGGALNAQEAMGVLASTISAFEALPGQDLGEKLLPGGIEGLQKVADVLTVVQNNLGTNVEVTAEGVSRMAGLARQMNLSFEQTAVFTAQIAKQTNQTGAAAGEQFSRILSSLQTGRGRGAITQAYGAPVEAALAQGDYGRVLEEMIKGWDGLSDSQKRNVAVSVAGQRQAAAFNALMNNGSKTLNVLAKAENANGDAAERMDKLMNTLNKRLDVFGTQVQNVASNLVRTGLLNFLGLVLLGANEMFGAVNDVLTLFNKFADENAFLGFLRQSITLLLGASIAIKAVQYGVGGLRGALGRSQVGQNAMAGVAEARTARTSRILAGPDRPAYSDYRRPGVVSRTVGFGLDRSLGVGVDATGRGLTGLGTKLRFTTDELGKTTEATGRFRRGLALGLQTAGAGATAFSGGLRDTLQGRANQRFGSAGFAGRSLAYQGEADRLRAQITGGATSGAAGDARLERQARANERLGRANDYAGRSIGRLSDGANKLGKSGALADTALIGFTLVLGSVIDGFRDAAALGKSADAGLDRLIKQAKTGEDARLASRQAEYVGPTAEDYDARLEQMRNDSWFDRGRNRFTAATTAALKGDPRSLYSFGLDSSSINRELGINGTYEDPQAIGTQEAEDLKKRGQRLLNSFGDTAEGVGIAQRAFRSDLARRAQEIKSDENLSEGEKQAAAAELEQIGKSFSDQVADMAATAAALGQTYALTVEQIKRVNEAAQAFTALGGRTAIGDLDLRPLYGELITDTGAEQGSQIGRLLERMSNGTSDSVDQVVLNSRLLKAEIKNLYAVWTSKLEEDPEAAEDAKQALMAAISSFGQANTQAVTAIFDQANVLSSQLSNTGRLEQGNQLWGKALDRAVRIFDHEAEDVKKSMEGIGDRRSRQQAAIGAMQAAMDAAGVFGGGDSSLLLGPLGGAAPTQLPRWKRKWGAFDESNPATEGFAPPVQPGERAAQRQAAASSRKANDQIIITALQGRVQTFIEEQTADLRVKSAKEKDPKVKARIDHMIAKLTLDILRQVNAGIAPEGSNLGSDKNVDRFGNAAVANEQITGALEAEGQSALAYQQSTKDMALQAAQNAADIQQAQIGVRAALADARGDAVAAARAQIASARAALALARQQAALAVTPAEVAAAKVATLNAQAQLIAANAAVSQAQQDLVQSRFQVAIAIAEAAGRSVLAARRTLAAARQALSAALKKSGGEATAEVNAARVQAIQAEAALRDAKLQDSLDTIDFNLQMGKITQASAIAALQEILRTQDLTRQQRRQLLLQIKGMKEELSDSQWNFGDIKLPTAYQMRRYVAERRDQFRNELDVAAAGSRASDGLRTTGSASAAAGNTTIQHIRFDINGADTAKVMKIIRDVVGTSAGTNVRTTGSRRGR